MTETIRSPDAARDDRGVSRRILYLFAAAAILTYSFRFLVNAYYDRDQLCKGLPATALVERFPGPISQFQYGQSHGLFVYGALLAPVYYWAGSRLPWIKLLGALFVAGGVFFWTLIVARAFGRTAAALFLLFAVFPPPFFDWSSHCGFWGNHLECIFFSGLLFFGMLRQARCGQPKPRRNFCDIGHAASEWMFRPRARNGSLPDSPRAARNFAGAFIADSATA